MTTMLDGHAKTGGLVLTTVTVWLHVAVLLQASVISQVCVKYCGQKPLVTAPVGMMVRLLPHEEEADGGSKAQMLPHDTVLLVAQLRVMPPVAGQSEV